MQRTERPTSRYRNRAVALIACSFPLGSDAGAQTPAVTTYVFDYPYDTPELIEDHLIVLERTATEVRGWFYGTSDEFDAAREAYLPGFFVAPMADLAVSEDAISFVLHRPDRFFASPVPLQYRRAEDVPPGLLDRWNVQVPTASSRYTGTLHDEEIVLQVPGGPRVFRRAETER